MVPDATGVRRWRPLFDAIEVRDAVNGGRRVCVVVDGDTVAQFDLDAAAAAALAQKLTAEIA